MLLLLRIRHKREKGAAGIGARRDHLVAMTLLSLDGVQEREEQQHTSAYAAAAAYVFPLTPARHDRAFYLCYSVMTKEYVRRHQGKDGVHSETI